jgi:hypothetical protein
VRRFVAASFLAFLLSACTSTSGGAPSPAPSVEPTPGERVLLEIHEECTGLASLGACDDAEVACGRAYLLYEAAKLPADDAYRKALAEANIACEKKRKRESNVHVH